MSRRVVAIPLLSGGRPRRRSSRRPPIREPRDRAHAADGAGLWYTYRCYVTRIVVRHPEQSGRRPPRGDIAMITTCRQARNHPLRAVPPGARAGRAPTTAPRLPVVWMGLFVEVLILGVLAACTSFSHA